MATRSIIDVEVNDAAFQNFQAMFQKYQDAVAKMPGAWGKVGRATEGAVNSYDDLVRAAQVTASATASIALRQQELGRATAATDRSSESLARNTAKVAHNITGATTSLLKWTGILGAVGGLLGAGGIWGIDRLAASAAGARRSAAGMGVSSAESQAFAINYSRFVDPNGFLENVSNAKSNYEDRWAFNALGIQNPQDKDADELAQEVMRNGKRMFDASDHSSQFAEANGLTKFFSMSDLRRMQGIPQTELDKSAKDYQRDKQTLVVDPAAQRAWTDFTAQMDRAGAKIENVFVTGLVPLAGPLEHLSNGVTDAITAFAKSPIIGEAIAGVGTELESLAKWLDGPVFERDVDAFEAGLRRMTALFRQAFDDFQSGSFYKLLSSHLPGADDSGFIGPPDPKAKHTLAGQLWHGLVVSPAGLDHDGQNAWLGAHSPSTSFHLFGSVESNRMADARAYFKAQGHSEEDTAAILGNISAESGFDPAAVNPAGGGKGAQGILQWRGDRIARFTKIFNVEPKAASFTDQLAFAEWEMEHTEQKAADKVHAASSVRDKTDTFRREFQRPGDDDAKGYAKARKAAHDEIWAAMGRDSDTEDMPYTPPRPSPPASGLGTVPQRVTVDIRNVTGGSAVVTAKNAAAQ